MEQAAGLKLPFRVGAEIGSAAQNHAHYESPLVGIFKMAGYPIRDPAAGVVRSMPTSSRDCNESRITNRPGPVDSLAFKIMPVIKDSRIR
jgi:hypothetical protein